jgi:hypothetical protein
MTLVETILFPFTFIGPPQTDFLKHAWPQITVYRPSSAPLPNAMQRLAHEGHLSMRSPAFDHAEQLEVAQTRLTAWGEQFLGPHGPKGSEIRARQTDIPFFEASYPSHIVADLKNASRGQAEATSPEHMALQARLFLLMAQELDRRLYETDKELDMLEAMEDRLHQALHGHSGFDGSKSSPENHERYTGNDPGYHLTYERLRAWARLLLEDQSHWHQRSALVFLTTSPAVFDSLANLNDQGEWLTDEIDWPLNNRMKATPDDWRQVWDDYWHSLCVSKEPQQQLAQKPSCPLGPASAPLKLNLMLALHRPPSTLFANMLTPPIEQVNASACLHTLFILAAA